MQFSNNDVHGSEHCSSVQILTMHVNTAFNMEWGLPQSAYDVMHVNIGTIFQGKVELITMLTCCL